MEFDEKIEFCTHLMAMDYDIDEHTAHRIIYNFDIEDAVIERYEEEIAEKEEDLQREYEYNKKLYNDGWNDHVGV